MNTIRVDWSLMRSAGATSFSAGMQAIQDGCDEIAGVMTELSDILDAPAHKSSTAGRALPVGASPHV